MGNIKQNLFFAFVYNALGVPLAAGVIILWRLSRSKTYSLRVGQTIKVLCTLEGRPIVNQFVMAGWESREGKLHALNARTNRSGIARFKLAGAGKWYGKMIHIDAALRAESELRVKVGHPNLQKDVFLEPQANQDLDNGYHPCCLT